MTECIPFSAIKTRDSSLGDPQTAGVGWREAKMSNWKGNIKQKNFVNNTGTGKQI